MWNYIKSDLYRYYGNCKFITFCRAYIFNKTFRTQVAIRLGHSANPIVKVVGCNK